MEPHLNRIAALMAEMTAEALDRGGELPLDLDGYDTEIVGGDVTPMSYTPPPDDGDDDTPPDEDGDDEPPAGGRDDLDVTAIADYLRWIHPRNDTLVNSFVKAVVKGKGDSRGVTLFTVQETIERCINFAEDRRTAAVWCSVHTAKPNTRGAKWTRDDVARYQFLALDLDNVPATPGTCATSAERERVADVADKLADSLRFHELPEPLRVDTGNGQLLLVPMDVEATEDAYQLLRRLGAALAHTFNTQHVNLDTAVIADPCRILGVIGTCNRNKREVPGEGRFPRLRRVIGDYPDREPMPGDQFIAWATAYVTEFEALNPVAVTPPPPTESRPVSIKGTLADPRVQASPEVREHTLQRVKAYLAKIPGAIEGSGGDLHTFKTAGKLLAFGLNVNEVIDLMSGDWNSTCSPPWGLDELRKKVESAERNGTPRTPKTVTTSTPAVWGGDDPLGDDDADGIVFETFSEITAKAIDWIWPGRVAVGKLTVIAGDPGKGKSFLSLDIAARLSTGSPFPDGHTPTVGTTLLITDEDDSEDTIKPRLLALNANTSKITRLKAVKVKGQEFNWTLKLVKMLTHAVKRIPDLRLIIIDPLFSYFGGAKSADPAEVNAMLGQLNAWADEHGIAVVALVHMTKDSKETNALYRSMGSIGVVGKARLAFLVAPDKTDPELRVMAQTKANSAAPAPTIAYKIVSTTVSEGGLQINTARVEWQTGDYSHLTADELITKDRSEGKQDAEDFLREVLTKPTPSKEITDLAKARGITYDTLRRAREKIGIRAEKQGLNGPWIWHPVKTSKGEGETTPDESVEVSADDSWVVDPLN